MEDVYTPEMVWDSARQNEMDTVCETGGEYNPGDSAYLAARNIEDYAEMFGADPAECVAYARSVYPEFDWARKQ